MYSIDRPELLKIKRFYVYSLNYKGIPFYIGKGQGSRCTHHFRESKLKVFSHKNNKIKKIINSGGIVDISILLSVDSESLAFEMEKHLIGHYGRSSFGGLLTNLTDGGEGPSGMVDSDKTRKIKSNIGKQLWDSGSVASQKLLECCKLYNNGSIKDQRLWCLADKAYLIWAADKSLSRNSISKLLGEKPYKCFESFVVNFRKGWIPQKDKDYLEFKRSLNSYSLATKLNKGIHFDGLVNSISSCRYIYITSDNRKLLSWTEYANELGVCERYLRERVRKGTETVNRVSIKDNIHILDLVNFEEELICSTN